MNLPAPNNSLGSLPHSDLDYTDCLFQQSWWLDAVAPGSWHTVEVEERGRLVARLPYVVRSRWGLLELTQPLLTPCLGPWLEPHTGSHAQRLARQKQLMTGLIEKLPPFDLFRQGFSPNIKNWHPFYWKGFQQTTRYTYRIEVLSDLDALFSEFDGNVRQNVRKAQRQVEVRHDLDTNAFVKMFQGTYRRKGRPVRIDASIIRRIDRAGGERNARRFFYAVGPGDRIYAAILLVYDHRCAYYLGGGFDPEVAQSGAMTLLIWEAIKFAAGVSQSFDFEGTMVEKVERFFRKFAARQTPYFYVSKLDRRLRPLAWLRNLI